jgi:hypothetical protein
VKCFVRFRCAASDSFAKADENGRSSPIGETDEIKAKISLVVQNRNIVYAFSAI